MLRPRTVFTTHTPVEEGDDVPLLYLEDYDSFFNTHRMVRQYQLHAYAPARRPAHPADEARPGA